MTNEIEKKFFDAFGIERNILQHQQFNYTQVPRGLEFFKTREELANTGMIKISYKKLTPTAESYCIYWGEYHYPKITDRILLKLICLLVAHYWETKEHYYLTALDKEYLRKEILSDACYVIDGMFSREKEVDFINQVRALFGESEEKQ